MTGETVRRFTATERALHWAFAVLYLALLATGLPLMFPALRGSIRGYAPVIGLRLHVACALLWIAVTLAVILLGNRRALRRTWQELISFDAADVAWLRRFPRWLLGGPAERRRIDRDVGRFNAGQKLNALFIVSTSVLLVVTGLALVPIDGTLPASLVTGSHHGDVWRHVHRWLTLVVLLPVAGHVFLALVFPATRPSVGGMLRGVVERDWARRHYPRWDPGSEPERQDPVA